MITPTDVDFVSKIVHAESAIVLDQSKEYLIESRLTALARERGEAGPAELVRKLRSQPNGPLRDQVVEAMTTNETSFFRDVHPFRALGDTVLPEMMVARAKERSLNIWFAACSSGQEPYTVAMQLRELLGNDRTWRTNLLATDISPQMVKRTREGMYSQLEVNRGLPAPMLVRYFTRQGMSFQVAPELRSMIQAREMNLAAPFGPMPQMDIVFLRNVLIYFDTATKTQILTQIRRVLRPDGYLFLGAAETPFSADDHWERQMIGRATVFRPRS